MLNLKGEYGLYESLLINNSIMIDTNMFTSIDILNQHYDWILNILKDGIELKEVHQDMRFQIKFPNIDFLAPLSITDYFINLVFWSLPVSINNQITSVNLFYEENGITKNAVKDYIDDSFVRENVNKIDFVLLNNYLDDCIYKLKVVDKFSWFLANTVDIESFIRAIKEDELFDNYIHSDLSYLPIGEVKAEALKRNAYLVDYIKNRQWHSLANALESKETINIKQLCEVILNIGAKPNGLGEVFPYFINSSFLNGGVRDPKHYIIESSVGRVAQILSKMNVGISGAFARVLELNNLDTFFNSDPNYSCNTMNFENVFIENETWLKIYDKRYYRFSKDGVEKCLDYKKDKHLIGRTLMFRSPMTCASHADGYGICHKCYGDLYHINININPGKIASDFLSSIFTQKMLSAKHLLEAIVVLMEWDNKKEFFDIFNLDFNTINLYEDIDYSKYQMVIHTDNIEASIDDEDFYQETISYFDIIYPDKSIKRFKTANDDEMFISIDLNSLIVTSKKIKSTDETHTIPLELLKDIPFIFQVDLQNKELSKTLKEAKAIINNNSVTLKFDRHEIIKQFIQINLDGGINISAVHLETILSNQIRSVDDVLDKPDWTIEDSPYQLMTLNTSLTKNPSITISLVYQKVEDLLISPLASRKYKPSVVDVFFMKQPQLQMDSISSMTSDEYKTKDQKDLQEIKPIPMVVYDEE